MVLDNQIFFPSRISTEFKFQDIQWSLDGRYLVWSENRSGKGVLVCWDAETGNRRDLTREISVSANIGYGGAEFTVNRNAAYFVSGSTLFYVELESGPAQPIYRADGKLAAPVVSPDNRWLILINSRDEKDQLCLLDLETAETLFVLNSQRDFYMHPVWHPEGEQIAWISWDHPHMPWGKSDLHTASIDWQLKMPQLSSMRVIENDHSHFQPEFSPNGEYLSFVSDETGWSNLQLVRTRDLERVRRFNQEYEHDQPAWVQGLRTYGWNPSGDKIFLIRRHGGISNLCRLDIDRKNSEPVASEESYLVFRQLTVNPVNGQLSVLASSPSIPWRILSFHWNSSPRIIARSHPEVGLSENPIELEPVSWDTGDSTRHGLISVSSEIRGKKKVPFVVRIHGGPTSQYSADFEFETQFFTRLGFGIFSLNYRGSVGYGRKYRELLNGQWGVYDVDDVDSALNYLVEHRNADPGKIVLAGGSAAGLTILLCLVRFPGRFRAAICRYPVSDLLSLADQTHRFEKHYLDSLLGPLPKAESVYLERSPSEKLDQICDPVAIFQGGRDPVVPREQTDSLAAALKENGVPHFYRVYPEEGHGWKRIDNVIDYYRSVDEFLQRHL